MAQDGGFYITDYEPSGESLDNFNFQIIQDEAGVINIANRGGIIRFDGSEWSLIKTPAPVFAMALDEKTNTLYAGGQSGLGKINFDSNLNEIYVPLTDSVGRIENISQLILFERKLYGINQESIYIYNLDDESFKLIKPKYSGELLSIGMFNDQVYATSANGGFQWLTVKGLKSPEDNQFKSIEPIFVQKNLRKNSYLIGNKDNRLSIYEEGKMKSVDLGYDQQFLNSGVILDAKWINSRLIAVATLKNGVVFVDVKKGKIDQILNYQTGLPDNEVYAIGTDKDLGIWIAHNKGFTRVSPRLPFRSYDRYPGLQGEVLSLANHNDTLFVGTSLGLFFLAEVIEFEERTEYVKSVKRTRVQQPRAETKQESQPASEPAQKVQPEPAKRKKGGLGFLRRKRNRKNKEVEISDNDPSKDTSVKVPAAVNKKSTKTTETITYKKKTTKELLSSRYEYLKVDGLNSKVFHLYEEGSRLFVSGLDGAYEIVDRKAVPIIKDPVRYMHIQRGSTAYISTYNDQILVFDISRTSYPEIYMFGESRSYVNYIFEDNRERIWFFGTDNLYWIKTKGRQIIDNQEFFTDDSFLFDTYGLAKNDSIFLISGSDIYYVNEKKEKIEKIVDRKAPDRMLAGANGEIWQYDSKNKWSDAKNTQATGALDLLSLLKDIKYIASDHKNNFWVVSKGNDIYKLPSEHNGFSETGYKLLLRKIFSGNKNLSASKKFELEQEKSSLSFEFVLPEYSGVLDVQYQYKLKGLKDKWSEWSPNYRKISFPYLPDGKYELQVRSKNVLGHVHEIDPISFKVLPPYWKRPWFYGLEFAALALLLFISIRLKKMGYRYRLMSRLLALLTLIIILEFIEAIAESKFDSQSSPVVGFIIQVTMAIIILPLEGMLRKYIFRDKEVNLADLFKIKK